MSRLRCPTRAAQHFWTVVALVLGPLGLVWMRVVVGKTYIAEVGAGERAVNLEETPSNTTPWPEPHATGTEVMA